MFPITFGNRTKRMSEPSLAHYKVRVLDDGPLVADAMGFAVCNAFRKDLDVAKPGPGNSGYFLGYVALSALAEMKHAYAAGLQPFADLPDDRFVDAEICFLSLVDERQGTFLEIRVCPSREPQTNPVRYVEAGAVVKRR